MPKLKLFELDTAWYISKDYLTRLSIFRNFITSGALDCAKEIGVSPAIACGYFHKANMLYYDTVSKVNKQSADQTKSNQLASISENNMPEFNAQAFDTWLRKSGFLNSLNGHYELSEIANSLLEKKISEREYYFLILSKQWIKLIDEENEQYLDNLLYVILSLFKSKKYDVSSFLSDLETDILNCYRSKYPDVCFTNKSNLVRYLEKPLLYSELIIEKDRQYVLNEDYKEIIEDYISNHDQLIDVKNSNVEEEIYWNSFKYGFYDLITDENKNLYSSKYPNLFNIVPSTRKLPKKVVQKILHGAPGTGKTYLAKKEAAEMITGIVKEDSQWNEMTDDQRKQRCFVQFHPSYDYTDFVEGIRPQEDGSFKLEDGIFKHFCKEALKQPDKPFYLIIDEFNRGELPKILGELFSAIEPAYRGPEGLVKTQYNAMIKQEDVFYNGFFVPENVNIIATMNDIDRGAGFIDMALLRRFSLVEITAKESEKNMKLNSSICNIMDALNAAIEGENLSSAYHIGGSYFLDLNNKKDPSIDDYNTLWDEHLQTIISHYFTGHPDAIDQIDRIKQSYNDAVKKEYALDE